MPAKFENLQEHAPMQTTDVGDIEAHGQDHPYEQLDEASLRDIGDHVIQAAWLTKSEAARYLNSGSVANEFIIDNSGNVGRNGYQKGYRISEVPIALPIGSRASLDPLDAKRLKPWADLNEDERSLYSYDLSAGDTVAFTSLKPEMKQALLAQRTFEVTVKSKDTVEIAEASERNKHRFESGTILRSTDLTHATKPQYLPTIFNDGLLAGELIEGAAELDKFPYNLDVSTAPVDAEKYATDYDTVMGAANLHANGNVLLVLDRSEQATDAGNEVDNPVGGEDFNRHNTHRLIFGGVPSTEIAAICINKLYENTEKEVHNAHQTALMVVDQVLQHGQYIPVLGCNGEVMLTPEQFEVRRASGDYGNFVKKEFVDQLESEIEIPTMPGFGF